MGQNILNGLMLLVISFAFGWPIGGFVGLFQGKDRQAVGGLPPGALLGERKTFTSATAFNKSFKARSSLIMVYIVSVLTFLFILYMKGTTKIERLIILILTVVFALTNYFYGKRPTH